MTTGKKPVNLKDPKGGSYCRSGKEMAWRCSSKSKCPAKVRKLKRDDQYTLYNKHTCSKSYGPTDVPAIPADIQARLGDTHEALTEFVNGLDWNVTQHQGTV